MAEAPKPFKPALIVVDFQEDFCPPSGSLAVPDGRTIATTINSLLHLPFAQKVATKDWHPTDHISFASNHAAPNNEPFTSSIKIPNPSNSAETQDTRLWPVHCVQETFGAQLVPELEVDLLTEVIEKGKDSRVEMYSAFYDPFRVSDSGLVGRLKRSGVTHVFVVGLAFDYCVKCTAVDAAREGFGTFVVREGTKGVDEGRSGEVEEELKGAGVKIVGIEGVEVGWVKALVG